MAERIQIADLNAEASFVERMNATEYEAEALRIQEQMAKAEEQRSLRRWISSQQNQKLI